MFLCKSNNLELFASKSAGRSVKYIHLNLLIRMLLSVLSENLLHLFCLFQSWLEMTAFSLIETPKCTISLKVIAKDYFNLLLFSCVVLQTCSHRWTARETFFYAKKVSMLAPLLSWHTACSARYLMNWSETAKDR